MRPSILFILSLCIMSLVQCSSVLNLTDQNFNSTISSNKYVMVKFFAPWCGHCKTMAPEYEKLAELLKDNGVVIAELNAEDYKELGTAQKVEGYPTVKFFIDGHSVDYKGPREADPMFKWIKEVTQITLDTITDEKLTEERSKQNLIVYYGSNSSNLKTVELLNIIDSSITYFVSSVPSSQQKLVLYELTKQGITYPDNLEFSIQQIKTWSLLQLLPTVIPLSSKQYLDWVFYDQATLKDVIMLLREDDTTDEQFAKIQQFCKKNQDFKCCYITKQMEVYGGVKSYLRGKGHSVLAVTKQALSKAYAFPKPIAQFNQQTWKQFIAQVNDKKHKNLADVPSEVFSYQNVQSLTDQTFSAFIKENKVVFVEYYSPACKHCIKFAPQYDEIAKNASNAKLNIAFAAVDCKTNEKVANQSEVVSFPSFKLFLDGQAINYDGERSESAILSFIDKARSSHPILVNQISQVPSPSVLIYSVTQESPLKLLAASFTRLPIYQIISSQQKVILFLQQKKAYTGQLKLNDVTKWLQQETLPTLINLVDPNVDKRLMEGLQQHAPLIALIDIQQDRSKDLHRVLQQYCKQNKQFICGYAQQNHQNFKDFATWTSVEFQNSSKLLFINTQSFEKYLFNQQIYKLSQETLQQFIADVKDGKLKKVQKQQPAKQQEAAKQETSKQKQVKQQTTQKTIKQESKEQSQPKTRQQVKTQTQSQSSSSSENQVQQSQL